MTPRINTWLNQDMADATDKTASPFRARVSNVDYQVRSWARRYGVSEDRLREAVTKDGPALRNPAGKREI
jgi:hypothetical protein